jgi:hypothetical protein
VRVHGYQVIWVNVYMTAEISLASRKQKQEETNSKIVDLFKEALDEIKNCRTEQQRVEFHIALACVMSPREAKGNKNGWIKPTRSPGLETRQVI